MPAVWAAFRWDPQLPVLGRYSESVADDTTEFLGPPVRHGQLVEAAGAGLVGAVPIAGPSLQEIVHLTMGAAYQKRLDGWFSDVAASLDQLQQRGDAPSWAELSQDDDFLDALLRATRAAQSTGREEKRRALRNAVMSSARSPSPHLHRDLRFIDLVDSCAPDHLRLLLFLDDPRRALRLRNVSVKEVKSRLEKRFRDQYGGSADPPLDFWYEWMRTQQVAELLKIFDESSAWELHADLDQWRLIGGRTTADLWASYLTESGQDFLRFVDVTPATAEAFAAFAEKQW